MRVRPVLDDVSAIDVIAVVVAVIFFADVIVVVVIICRKRFDAWY